MKIQIHPAMLLAFAASAEFVSAAEPSATVRRVFGKASSPATISLPVGADFSTGEASRAELDSSRGAVRVGERAKIEMQRGGGLVLRQGVTLVASNPGTFRKTIEVRAPGYRAKVKGTAQIAYEPGRVLKIVVLEGSVTVALDSLAGEFETLEPGQQLILNPSDNRLPDPVEVDLGRLVSTSKLVGGLFGKLATAGLIDASISDQSAGIVGGDLASTPFLLRGTETELEILQIRRAAQVAVRAPDPKVVEQTIFRNINDLDDPKAIVREKPFMDGMPSSELPVPGSGGSLTITRDEGARTNLLRVSLMGDDEAVPVAPARLNGTIRVDPDVFAGSPRTLEFSNNTPLDSDQPGFERLQIESAADIKTPAGVGLSFLSRGFDINGARLQSGNGTRNSELLNVRADFTDISIVGGSDLKGGRIVVAGGSRATTPQTITIDDSTLTARQQLAVGISSVRTGIVVRNSSELASLVNNLDLLSAGEPITVESSQLKAGRQLTIDATSANSSLSSVVSIRDAQLMADTIKVRAFSPVGDALVIDGSTFNASTLIRLYAEGVSTLRFRNNVTLTTPQADLAGRTVEVDSGGTVNISGKGRVFTDRPNFNTGGFGTIQAGGGVTVKPFGNRPKF